MIKQKILFLITLLLLINLKVSALETVYIAFKIDDEIITNIDIKKEADFLIAMNETLETIDKNQLVELSKRSIIKETIKKKELSKYFELNQKGPYLDTFMQNLIVKLNLTSLDEFEAFLNNYDLKIDEVKKKIEIDYYWNKLIYEKYKNQLDINKDAIREKISKKKLIKDKKIYELSEIIFEKDQNISLEDKVNSISESISEIGFKNTANLYSISDSNKYGGSIGWVEEISLSEKISKILSKTDLGNYTETIKIGANFLILKIDNIKFEKSEIDEEKEFSKIYNFEADRKLEQLSKIYFNKIKINTKIDEL
jgi:peptidyl-prolyl cis-trans isomerase SurA|tara:strand:- start:180 stop:1112 length:933 start_codon:yes stop_codon:yes gene_type:complete